VAFFDRLRRLVPGPSPSDPYALGARELERGRLDSAAAYFETALVLAQSAPAVAAVRNKRAVVAIRRGDREGAIAELVAALEAHPRCAAAITTIANLLLEDGAIDEAIVHYEYAILVDDAYAPAYHNFGVALHRRGRRAESVRMLRKATQLEGRVKHL
jgi:protein O-GlcNAc transferase